MTIRQGPDPMGPGGTTGPMSDRTAIIRDALRQIPCGLFVMTSAFEASRYGLLARWVQPCSDEPPMVMVSIPIGTPIESIIRDARTFALCQIGDQDRLLRRRFVSLPDRDEDPFVTLPHRIGVTGSPVLDRAVAWLECELVRHVDLEADHRLFVGLVLSAAVNQSDERPAIEVGGNGLPRRETPDPE